MQTVNILLSDHLKEFVEAQVNSGQYGSVGEYLHALIRDAEQRKAKEKLEALLLEGVQSPSSEMARQDWDNLRVEAVEQLELKRAKRTA